MPWNTLQVTLGAAATQVSPSTPGSQIFCRQVLVQNNAAHNVRLGDALVSGTRGLQLNTLAGGGGGSFNAGPVSIYNTYLSDLWLFGTAADIIDVFYNT